MANVCAVRTIKRLNSIGTTTISTVAFISEAQPHEPAVMTEEMRRKAHAAGLSDDQICRVGDPLARTFGTPKCRFCGSLYAEES